MIESAFQSVIFAVGLWITLSTVVIVYNASLLHKFRHPITLIAWHMLVGSVMTLGIRLVKPGWMKTGDPERGLPPLTLWNALRLGTPIGFLHAASMIAGNSAYLYLNVSFIQMIKAWTAGCVYFVGCGVGTQTWSLAVAKTIAMITFGLSIASYGELEFNMWGFVLQVVSICLEGGRINLLELTLKSQGYKLNPLSSLQIFAPIMFGLLLPCAIIWDRDALSMEEFNKVGAASFSVNALCAFFLNMAVYLVIQTASGLIFALGGVMKDLIIIFGSAVFLGQAITGMQIFGYVIALAGLQVYGIVSKDTEPFEEAGVLPELQRRIELYLWPQRYKQVKSPEVENDEEIELADPRRDGISTVEAVSVGCKQEDSD